MKPLGHRLKDKRLLARVSASELAEALGISRSTLWLYEEGRTRRLTKEWADRYLIAVERLASSRKEA